MEINFHFYRGLSFISKIIKWRTRGIYSHVAIEIDNNVYEAWEKYGVVKASSTLENHTHKTPIDTIEINTKEIVAQNFKLFLEAQINKKYDWRAIISFIGSKNIQDKNRWFCSELANMFFVFEQKQQIKTHSELISPQRFFERLKFYKIGINKGKKMNEVALKNQHSLEQISCATTTTKIPKIMATSSS